VLDPLDYFLMSALVGTVLASQLKIYLSGKASMKRLENSLINNSSLLGKKTIMKSSKSRIKRIYKFSLSNRGGQIEDFQADYSFSNEVFNLAQEIKKLIERLAVFLKDKELKGVAKLFFRNGKLVLELILYKCNGNITYAILNEGLSAQVIVITACVSGAVGGTIAWFSFGAALVSLPLIISILLLRSVTQQILNLRDYSKFKNMVNKMLDNDELRKTIKAFFMDNDGPTIRHSPLQMDSVSFDEKSIPDYNRNFELGEDFEKFIKVRMKEELELIENPSEIELEKIIDTGFKRRPKRKTAFFKDFLEDIPYEAANLSDFNIIDAEILEEPIRIHLDNEI
jgi:hypothetical protein